MFTIVTGGPDQTEALGRILGSLLEPGDVVCLYGDLGAGKTTFSCGVALGLEVQDRYITSPTFAFVNEYRGRIPFYHLDLYRITDPAELEEIGFDEYVDSDGAAVIEWAERAEGFLPDDVLSVYLSEHSGTSREIGFLAEGERSRTLLTELTEKLKEGTLQQP